MVNNVELYHFPPSLCSQKVRLALSEKGVSWTPRLVNIGPLMENYQPWYARINPRMVVPTLAVDGEFITNSAHIVAEVDRRFDGPDLGSSDPGVQRWIALLDAVEIREIAYSRQSGVLGFLTKGSFDKRLKVLRAQQAENPDLAAIYQARIDDVNQWREVSASSEAIATRTQAIHSALAELAEALEVGPWVMGERYTMADVIWTVMLARLKFMGFSDGWPASVQTYYQQLKARPSFEQADIWERIKPLVMLPILGEVIATRLGLG